MINNKKQPMTPLHETVNTQKEALKNFTPEVFTIPQYITKNLRHSLFQWQQEALENLLYYEHPQSKQKQSPAHLMFNMATGTGKTLLMAASILYYYMQGYRHVLFFTNQNNIVDKTENNFINTNHSKYLFTENIVINDKTITIKQVDTFSDEPQGIEIKCTTVQKLYNDIHIEKENQTTLDDLHTKDIVMLADEAHHLNTDTNKKRNSQPDLIETSENNAQTFLIDSTQPITNKTSKEDIERKGWEHTVITLVLHKDNPQQPNKNVLLEFTATIPETAAVDEKYRDKIIYRFDLKDFLQQGYTKQINLIPSSLSKKERILQALLFYWYRHKIAIEYGIANFKPVILFRSKTIADSQQDYTEFLYWIDNIGTEDFTFMRNITEKIRTAEKQTLFEMGQSRTEQLLQFIKERDISYAEIAEFIKEHFHERNIIITNSQDNKAAAEKTTAAQEALLNNLEDKHNHIRAIFTVKRLTEGWDVLNLFDIVRLYEGRDEGKSTKTEIRKTGSATIAEKQLIGRGVRYYPFSYNNSIPNKRKFDTDINHPLRILEELYFYSTSDHRYIDELKRALKKDGYIDDNRTLETFRPKEKFRQSKFFRDTKIFSNKRIPNPHRVSKTLENVKSCFPIEYTTRSFELSEQEVNIIDNIPDQERLNVTNPIQTYKKKYKDIEYHIFRKALHKKQGDTLYQFETLQSILRPSTPPFTSMDNLRCEHFFGKCEVEIKSSQLYEQLDNEEKLNIATKCIETIITNLHEYDVPKIGGSFTTARSFASIWGEGKIKSIQKQDKEKSQQLSEELQQADWYVLDSFIGTSEERGVIAFIKDEMDTLQQQYKEVYLIRNEEVYKIYDFETGKGFNPDFLLLLETANNQHLHYQVFIEAKGDTFKDLTGGFAGSKEGWKEGFLTEITKRYGAKNIITAGEPQYRLIGLPFYNNDYQPFQQEWESQIQNKEQSE